MGDGEKGVFVNGKFCKDPKLATAKDFFFSGLDIARNTSNPLGSVVTPANVAQIPGLNTLGISLARVDYAPYGGLNPPHTHPRATEILTVLEGTLYVGFVTSNPDNRLITKVLNPGDVFVFPVGLIHFQFNVGKTKAVAIAALSSQNPGVITIANAVFGSTPPIRSDVLAKAFQVDKNIDPKLATAKDFFFSGLDIARNTSNPLGSVVTPANVAQIPGLNTLGISMARVDYAPNGGLNPPHTHPRATEILTVLEGTLYVGFVTSNPDNRLITKVLNPGDVFVFPVGLIHFQFNVGKTKAVAIAALSSQNPGVITIANAVFGSTPPIRSDVLAKAFQVDKNIDPKLAEAKDFFFSGLDIARNTSNPIGSVITPANVAQIPGLNTLGISMARVDYAPNGGLNPPHTHPRATEILTVLEGTLYAGFVTSSPDNRLITKVLNPGDVFVFPVGLIAFQWNVGKTKAVAIAAFSSQNPGIIPIANAVFGSTPPIRSDVLAKAFQVDKNIDFCVSINDTKDGVFVNGKFCKDPKLATAKDFFFSGLDIARNTSNPLGSVVTPANVAQIPGLNTLGISLARVDYAPYGGLNPPHTHPRATEILTVLEGTLYVGFVTSNPDNRLITKVLNPGDVFVFPVGLIHFQFNVGKTKAVAIAALSSQNPGVITIANAVFGSTPPIRSDVLAKAFQVDKNIPPALVSSSYSSTTALPLSPVTTTSSGLGSLPSLTSLLLRLPSSEDVELSKFLWLLLPSIDFFVPLLNFRFLWPSPSSCSERSLELFEFAHLSFFLPESSFLLASFFSFAFFTTCLDSLEWLLILSLLQASLGAVSNKDSYGCFTEMTKFLSLASFTRVAQFRFVCKVLALPKIQSENLALVKATFIRLTSTTNPILLELKPFIDELKSAALIVESISLSTSRL
uniref:Cupin type-1 domain-containing protein n=1 Tax=Salix viminalis TaxID=40686 RepID=A0A6N2NIC3_SALVM